jgi:hypothetical protein
LKVSTSRRHMVPRHRRGRTNQRRNCSGLAQDPVRVAIRPIRPTAYLVGRCHAAVLGPGRSQSPVAGVLGHLAQTATLTGPWGRRRRCCDRLLPLVSRRSRPSAQRAGGKRESRDRGVRVSPPPPAGPGHRPGPLPCPSVATEASVHAGYTAASACSRSRRSARWSSSSGNRWPWRSRVMDADLCPRWC